MPTLRDLAAKLKATVVQGDPAAQIDGVANLADAGPRDLAPYTDERYQDQAEKTNAGAVLSKSENTRGIIPPKSALLCLPDPEMSFIEAVRMLVPQAKESPGIDAHAIIEAGAEIGKDVHVGPFANIRAGARVGEHSVVMAHSVIGRGSVVGNDCKIYPRVVLYDGVTLGNRVIVHSGAVIGSDGFGYKFRGGAHVKVPQVGGVEIGDDVEIGANACIDRAALGMTRIGFGTKIDNLVQIGHNVRIGNHCILCGQAAIAGSSAMEDYSMLGGNAGVADRAVIGKGAKVGAKSGVIKYVPPGTEVFGILADERGAALRQIVAMRRLPVALERLRKLEKRVAALDGKGAADTQSLREPVPDGEE